MILAALFGIFLCYVAFGVAKREYFSDPDSINLDEDQRGQNYTHSDIFNIINVLLKTLGHHSCISVPVARRKGVLIKLRCFIQDNTTWTLSEYEVVGKVPLQQGSGYEIVSFSKRCAEPNTITGGDVRNGKYQSIRKSS